MLSTTLIQSLCQGMTQSQLAEKAHMSEKTISKLENGANITTDKLLDIIFTLNLDSIDFCDDLLDYQHKEQHEEEHE